VEEYEDARSESMKKLLFLLVSFFISAVSPTGNEKRFDQREQSASAQCTSTWESVRARQNAADMKF